MKTSKLLCLFLLLACIAAGCGAAADHTPLAVPATVADVSRDKGIDLQRGNPVVSAQIITSGTIRGSGWAAYGSGNSHVSGDIGAGVLVILRVHGHDTPFQAPVEVVQPLRKAGPARIFFAVKDSGKTLFDHPRGELYSDHYDSAAGDFGKMTVQEFVQKYAQTVTLQLSSKDYSAVYGPILGG